MHAGMMGWSDAAKFLAVALIMVWIPLRCAREPRGTDTVLSGTERTLVPPFQGRKITMGLLVQRCRDADGGTPLRPTEHCRGCLSSSRRISRLRGGVNLDEVFGQMDKAAAGDISESDDGEAGGLQENASEDTLPSTGGLKRKHPSSPPDSSVEEISDADNGFAEGPAHNASAPSSRGQARTPSEDGVSVETMAALLGQLGNKTAQLPAELLRPTVLDPPPVSVSTRHRLTRPALLLYRLIHSVAPPMPIAPGTPRAPQTCSPQLTGCGAASWPVAWRGILRARSILCR